MTRLTRISDRLFSVQDTCNAYVLVDGDAALVIDPGSGAVLDHLDDLGVARIEWVLQTHRHRDQCWGTPRLLARGARLAVPEYERHLFEQAELFWQTRRVYDNYDNRSTFFTVGEDMRVDAVLEDYERFAWRGYEFRVLPAKGHTFGSSALIATIDGRRVAFTGDLLVRGGKLADLHSMEYMYGGTEGLAFTLQSIQALRKQDAELALPSHGEPITAVRDDIDRLQRRIMDAVALGRGLKVGGWDSPLEVPFLPEFTLQPISPHLLRGGVWTCSNFYVVVSESGRALFIDYGHAFLAHCHIFADHEGLESMRFVEHRLDDLSRFGVTAIDVVIPTHVHDDHTCGIPYLQRHHDVRCWALEQVAGVLEAPAAWASTPCVLPKPIRIDRRLRDGERFRWEEFEFEIHHAPGQTEFHSVISATIDGSKVAFTGDNYFLDEVARGDRVELRPYQTTVLRNSFQLAMHRRCAEVMRGLAPELICPGHGEYLTCAPADIDDYGDFIVRKERVFRELVGEPAEQRVDLFWARMLPYLATVQPGHELEYEVLLRNNLGRRAYGVRLLPPPGWQAPDRYATLALEAGSRGSLRIAARAPERPEPRRRLMTAEISIDGDSRGPVCEALVHVAVTR